MWSDWKIGHRGLASLAALLLILGLTASAVRIIKKYQVPGPADPHNEGYCDFHNGVYFPSLAFRDGVSPYKSEYAAAYPVARSIPFFSPAILAFHAPLTLLPLRAAEVIYFAFMVALVLLIAAQSCLAAGLDKRFDWILLVAAGIVFSRGGHVTLFTGYFTFELVLAVILALRWADSRPLLSGMALVIASAKPTYILPLGFLMLARGNVRALVYGAGFSIITAAIPFAWLAWHEGQGDLSQGLSEIRQQIAEAQEFHHREPISKPALSWTRIDLFAVVAKWTATDPGDFAHLVVMLVILAIPMWVLYCRSRVQSTDDPNLRDDGVAGVTGAIIMTAMIVSLYRQSYDALLLAPPLVGVLAARLPGWQRLGTCHRWCLGLLMFFPAGNYFSTQMVLGRMDLPELAFRVVTSLNGVVMTILLVRLCTLGWTQRARNIRSSDASP